MERLKHGCVLLKLLSSTGQDLELNQLSSNALLKTEQQQLALFLRRRSSYETYTGQARELTTEDGQWHVT
jgi:hypothetical protein